MIGETLGGLSIFKTMFDLAKSIKDSNDATVRKGATIELQEQSFPHKRRNLRLLSK